MKNYTCSEIFTFLVDYIEYCKSNNDIPYHISIKTLENLLKELKEEYEKI